MPLLLCWQMVVAAGPTYESGTQEDDASEQPRHPLVKEHILLPKWFPRLILQVFTP